MHKFIHSVYATGTLVLNAGSSQSVVFSTLCDGKSSDVNVSQSPSPTRRTLASHNFLAFTWSLAAAVGLVL